VKDDDEDFKSPWQKKKPSVPDKRRPKPIRPEDDPNDYWGDELTSAHMSYSKQIGVWVVICVVCLMGYWVWEDTGRGDHNYLTRGTEIIDENGNKAITYKAMRGGHFIISAQINGVSIDFLLDTGATEIAFSKKDAELIGYDMENLNFNIPFSTANGLSNGARVKVDAIEFGPIYMKNVKAHVMGGRIGGSLLGMSFLNRLSGYEVRGGVLTLYP
jgi:aspartyl protease family protein